MQKKKLYLNKEVIFDYMFPFSTAIQIVRSYPNIRKDVIYPFTWELLHEMSETYNIDIDNFDRLLSTENRAEFIERDKVRFNKYEKRLDQGKHWNATEHKQYNAEYLKDMAETFQKQGYFEGYGGKKHQDEQ